MSFVFLVIVTVLFIWSPVIVLIAISLNGMNIFGEILQIVGIGEGGYFLIWVAALYMAIAAFIAGVFLKKSLINKAKFQKGIIAMLPWLLFTAYMWGRLLWGGTELSFGEYGVFKTFLFTAYSFSTIVILLIYYAFKGSREVIGQIEIPLFIFGLIQALMIIYEGMQIAAVRVTVMDTNPLGLARNMGLGMIAAVGIINIKWLRILCIAVFITGIIMTGSRGPLVAAAIVLFVYFFSGQLKSRQWRFLMPISVVLLIPLLYFLFDYFLAEFFARGSTSFAEHGNVTGRMYLYETALNAFGANPIFGIGVGQYAEVALHDYPHNLILELLAEMGIVGLLLFIIALQPLTTLSFKNHYSMYVLFALISLMFSTDLANAQILVVPSVLALIMMDKLGNEKGDTS
ncbi:O-antigen ligase family protein [Alkalicoccus saliphilus]|uniref:O-antigen ligase-related domain-containing protein n=1 Tax=Alkalicoccus saliphilus TaxID=200989 RepID=A0A2T4U2Y9_9BACI|nr:O-antigen ligase family protein [Alkalicoccus saliphilus]PTL37772.1 hypothetical protein C6Y45_14785 [Alkalicoccus saliphilus]